jgi:hypothetical protein
MSDRIRLFLRVNAKEEKPEEEKLNQLARTGGNEACLPRKIRHLPLWGYHDLNSSFWLAFPSSRVAVATAPQPPQIPTPLHLRKPNPPKFLLNYPYPLRQHKWRSRLCNRSHRW